MTVTIEQAQASLQELVDRTARGEKVLITRDNKAVAELVPIPAEKPTPRFGSCRGMLEIVSDDDEHLKELAPVTAERPARKPGFAKGVLTIIADDDEHLKDFKDYMP